VSGQEGIDPTIARQIVQERKIAFALVDRDLNVVKVDGALSAFDDLDASCVGHPLVDLAPEFVGCEDVLIDILDGGLTQFQLAKVNRETDSGETVYVDLTELPYRDASGQIGGLIHVVQEVTETGLLEQQLSQQRNELQLLQRALRQRNVELAAANTELKRLDDLKSQFVSVAAHELRNPLTAILGYVEMFLDEDLGPLLDKQRETIGIVYGASRRLLAITNDLLDVTRIETGRIELVLRPTDLGALVGRVVAEYDTQRTEKGQQLDLELDSGLPLALCDETRASQIVGNLVSNAIKYTGRGGRIAVRLERAEEEGFLLVSVSDTGMGLSAEDQTQLFSRFFRTEGARRSGTGGTGLGLYVARSLAEMHGGSIWLESEVGRGSTFYVTFVVADG
jgi:signal transduction histidine kinase